MGRCVKIITQKAVEQICLPCDRKENCKDKMFQHSLKRKTKVRRWKYTLSVSPKAYLHQAQIWPFLHTSTADFPEKNMSSSFELCPWLIFKVHSFIWAIIGSIQSSWACKIPVEILQHLALSGDFWGLLYYSQPTSTATTPFPLVFWHFCFPESEMFNQMS